MQRNELKWMGIGGLVFVGLAVALIAVVPKSPDLHASAAALAAHYTKSEQARYGAGGFVTMAVVVVGVFWFWYFRDLLASVAGARRLATVGFAGVLLFAAGGGLGAGIYFVLSDASGQASAPTYEVLNYAQANLNLGLTATGVTLFLLTTALVVIRSRALPVWLGWLAGVFAVVTFLITPFALILIGLWMIPTNIILLTRSRAGMEGASASAL
jgi:hypothetical protein